MKVDFWFAGGGGGEGCNMDELVCLSMVAQDRHGLEAIKALHKQLDDDADGNVDFSESDEVSPLKQRELLLTSFLRIPDRYYRGVCRY